VALEWRSAGVSSRGRVVASVCGWAEAQRSPRPVAVPAVVADQVFVFVGDVGEQQGEPLGGGQELKIAFQRGMEFGAVEDQNSFHGAFMSTKVRLRIANRRLYVSSFTTVKVEPLPRSRLTLKDLEFNIPTGAAGGTVSRSMDAQAMARGASQVTLIAGYQQGTHELQAVEMKTGNVVGIAKFEVSADWTSEDLGPPQAFTGTILEEGIGLAPGGGSPGPQNVSVYPALGTRRIAILFVDTSSERFPAAQADMNAIKKRWKDEVLNGLVVNGETYSVRRFYQEVSYGNFDLSGDVYGPVQLPGAWEDYFGGEDKINPTLSLYLPKSDFTQTCITSADALIDYWNYDTVLIVCQSISGMPRKWLRGSATLGRKVYTTSEGQLALGAIYLSQPTGTWDLTQYHLGNTQICDTVAHELGHNLGMGDLYSPTVNDPAILANARNPTGWDLMDASIGLPHFSLAHRMMLGWVPTSWIDSFNFVGVTTPIDEVRTLHPIERGAPPAGSNSRAGLEIRVADGWNYYVEYRVGQASHLGDSNHRVGYSLLGTDIIGNRVFGTDVIDPSRVREWPNPRPYLLKWRGDVDGDGPVLNTSQDFKDPDYRDLRVDAVNVDSAGLSATVRVRYGVIGQPDPSIRPWPAAPDRPWQSPDIEVRNAKNAGRPEWFNLPWTDHDNTVIARVRNSGDLDAPQVRVNFYYKIYTAAWTTPEVYINSDIRDITAGDVVEFTTNWRPALLTPEQHYCIVVRIPFYTTTVMGTSVRETTGFNNVAQSNYTDFLSGSISPAQRQRCDIQVANPYPIRTQIAFEVRQTNPLYRTYLGARWLMLDPGEVSSVEAMFEYTVVPDEDNAGLKGMIREYGNRPNQVSIYALITDPTNTRVHVPSLLGGVHARVRTGRMTEFSRFQVRRSVTDGCVIESGSGKPVRRGEIIVSERHKDGPEIHTTVRLKHGCFSVPIKRPDDCESVVAEYLPSPGYGDCRSNRIHPTKKAMRNSPRARKTERGK